MSSKTQSSWHPSQAALISPLSSGENLHSNFSWPCDKSGVYIGKQRECYQLTSTFLELYISVYTQVMGLEEAFQRGNVDDLLVGPI